MVFDACSQLYNTWADETIPGTNFTYCPGVNATGGKTGLTTVRESFSLLLHESTGLCRELEYMVMHVHAPVVACTLR